MTMLANQEIRIGASFRVTNDPRSAEWVVTSQEGELYQLRERNGPGQRARRAESLLDPAQWTPVG